MPNNKLKEKVAALTRVVQQLINEVQKNSTMSQGTLTALQVHMGEEDWNKLVKQLQEREQESLPKDKKLEL
tara:strand:- start:262 stop:474 length:213 start_codon:yes stop_codon:yes gene_type:complete